MEEKRTEQSMEDLEKENESLKKMLEIHHKEKKRAMKFAQFLWFVVGNFFYFVALQWLKYIMDFWFENLPSETIYNVQHAIAILSYAALLSGGVWRFAWDLTTIFHEEILTIGDIINAAWGGAIGAALEFIRGKKKEEKKEDAGIRNSGPTGP
jgi:hypothetical protein